jgi:hypothetical protein
MVVMLLIVLAVLLRMIVHWVSFSIKHQLSFLRSYKKQCCIIVIWIVVFLQKVLQLQNHIACTTAGYAVDTTAGGLTTLVAGSANHVTINIDSGNAHTTDYFLIQNNSSTAAAGNALLKVEENTTSGKISGACIKDEDNMVSNSADHLATQQSIKAYVDSFFESGTFDVTWTGLWAANKGPYTIKYDRAKNLVTANFLSAYGTSNAAATATSTAACLPASIRPVTERRVPLIVADGQNGVFWGTLIVKTTGYLELLSVNAVFGSGVDAGLYGDSSTGWGLS